MCSICGRMYCPGGCPGDDGEVAGIGFPVAECALCGEKLYRGTKAFCREEKAVCTDCVAGMQEDALLDLTDCGSVEELLNELGFSDEIL